jgi:hypothetical protein
MSSFKIYDPLRSIDASARRKLPFSTPQRSSASHPEGTITLTEKILRHSARSAELGAESESAGDSADLNQTASGHQMFMHEPDEVTVSATSGRNVLAFMKGTSDSLDNTKLNGVNHICAATALRETDRAIWIAMKKLVNTPEALFSLWLKESEFRQRDDEFRRDFSAGSENDLRICVESMFEYVVENKETSVELATKFILWSATRSIRVASNQSKAVIEFSNASRLMLMCDAYLDAEHISYEGLFRAQCQSRTLDLTTTVRRRQEYRPVEERPGWDRLTHDDADIRVTAWAWFLVDVVSFMAGAREKNQVDMDSLRRAFFCTKDVSRDHGLRFVVNSKGDFTDVFTWFPNEELAAMQLTDGARKAGRGKLAPDDYDRVCNALRCIMAKGSNDFRAEWNVQFGKHEQVPDDVVVPEDTNVPVISFELCKDIMKRTQLAVRKDVDKTIIRRKDMAKDNSDSQKRKVQDKSGNGGGGTGALPSGNQESNSGQCRVCQSKDHQTDVCPKRTGKPCSFWEKFGRCNFGSRCKLEHAAAAEGKGQGNGQVDLPAPLAASLAVGQSGAKRTQMISCKDKHARGCEPNFVIDLEFYEEKCEKEGWSMPKSCKACREKSKSDRINAERPVANLFTGHQDDHGDEYDEADDEFWCQDLQMAGLITADAVENVFTSEVTTLSPEVDNFFGTSGRYSLHTYDVADAYVSLNLEIDEMMELLGCSGEEDGVCTEELDQMIAGFDLMMPVDDLEFCEDVFCLMTCDDDVQDFQ